PWRAAITASLREAAGQAAGGLRPLPMTLPDASYSAHAASRPGSGGSSTSTRSVVGVGAIEGTVESAPIVLDPMRRPARSRESSGDYSTVCQTTFGHSPATAERL